MFPLRYSDAILRLAASVGLTPEPFERPLPLVALVRAPFADLPHCWSALRRIAEQLARRGSPIRVVRIDLEVAESLETPTFRRFDGEIGGADFVLPDWRQSVESSRSVYSDHATAPAKGAASLN